MNNPVKQKTSAFTITNKGEGISSQKTVVVMGCSRGGTSMVAGILRGLGIFMGMNIPGVNHEDLEFVTDDVEQIKKLIMHRNQSHDVWGWKYPHTIDYIHAIENDLRNPYFIVVFRNLFSVAASFKKYHPDFTIQSALAEAERRYRKIVEYISATKHPVLLLSYENTLAEKQSLIEGLIDYLDIKDFTPNRIKELSAFIDQEKGYSQIPEDKEKKFKVEKISQADAARPFDDVSSVWKNVEEYEGRFISETDPHILLSMVNVSNFPKSLYLSYFFERISGLGESKIYCDFGTGFSEYQTALVKSEDGKNCFRIDFLKPCKQIRIDPISGKGCFVLDNLCLHT